MDTNFEIVCHVRRVGRGVLLTYTLESEVEKQELAWIGQGEEDEIERRQFFKRLIEMYVEGDGGVLERLRRLSSVVEIGAVVVLDQEVVWVAGKGVQIQLVRDGRVMGLNSTSEWEVLSGVVRVGDGLVVTWGSEDLRLCEQEGEFVERLREAVDNEWVEGGWWYWGELENAQEYRTAMVREGEVRKEEVVEKTVRIGQLDDGRMPPSVWSRALGGVVRRLPREEAIYVLQDKVEASGGGRGRAVFVGVAILLLLVLFGSVGYGVWTRRERVFEENFGNILSEVEFKLGESVSLADLNPLRSEALLMEVDNLILQLESRGLAVEQLQQLRKQLGKAEGIVKGQFSVEPVPWQRLDLIRENLKMVDWSWSGVEMVGMDGQEFRVVSVDLNKSPNVLAGQDDVGKGEKVSKGELGTVVVNDQQLVRLRGGDTEPVGYDLQAEWGKIVDMEVFGMNVYLLTSSGIWKIGFEGEQLVAEEWIRDEALKGKIVGTRMAIDGEIWIANGSEVRRFIQGREDPYAIADLEIGLGNVKALFASEESTGLYLLDSDAARVVVVNKETGVYQAEYQWPGLNGVVSMVVKEEMGKMWWLGESEIWEVSLR